jgi:GTP diphosphokinase / guanosine-3',5'-bis(diphosphate) 3'-diphosphatase
MYSTASLFGRRVGNGFRDLLANLRSYLTEEQLQGVESAYQFAESAHRGQLRASGDPYITHPVAVAGILAELRLDYPSIVAALLHDVIEDTPTAKAEIAQRFGKQVAELVDGLSKLDQIRFQNKAEAQAESLRKMFLAVAEDIRVIVVKLADRLHNMRTLEYLAPSKQRDIARDTLEIYAPIAHRLGMNTVGLELEDLGFKFVYPQRYKVIQKALKRIVGSQGHVLKKAASELETALERHGMRAEVHGRSKDVYSIYQKMRKKGRPLSEIVDVFGYRVIVPSVDDCYRALGVVHKTFKPMLGRFKDYIAIPKVNGYQSLHTTLFGPKGVPIEVQIRSEDMNKVADSGIASHWQYKTGPNTEMGSEARAREWLKNLVELQEGSDSQEFVESLKLDLFPDKVYVFTPRGDVMRLPRGATAIDFAYAVHTDVGNRCQAVKVDRKHVPLRTILRNGQTLEVITQRGATPNAAWLNFVVTAKARSGIRQYLKNLRRGEAVSLGKRLLSNALADIGLTLKRIPDERTQALLKEIGLPEVEDLYAQVGLGKQLAPLLARRLAPESEETKATQGTPAPTAPLAILGTEGMVVSYARCCYPLPGDAVMGYLTAGRGIVIHRDRCKNLEEFRRQPEKWIAVEWKSQLGRDFAAEIRVEVSNRLGVLAAVAAKIADSETNIEHVSVVERDGDVSTLVFLLQLKERKQLARVMRGVKTMSEVFRVTRTCA